MMEVPEQIQVKIVSTPDIIEEFKRDWSAQGDNVQIVSSGPEKDLFSYQFGLAEVASLLGLVKGATYLGELAVKLYRRLTEGDDKDKRIIVQTPLGRWEFVSRKDLTQEEVIDILKKLAGVTP
jgi:hypothetical protein